MYTDLYRSLKMDALNYYERLTHSPVKHFLVLKFCSRGV